MSYTNVFGSATVPSAKAKFASFSLTTNQTFLWPYNASDTTYLIADIMEVTTTAGLSLSFPAANQVSVGESTLVRNTGSNQFTILDAAGGTLGTVASGTAKLFYVNDNTTVAGNWSVLTFGTGTSSADATTLAGYGLLAISSTLNDNHPVVTTPTAYTVTTANRANTIVFTSGSVNCTLPTLATAGDGFSVRVKNNGSGTITFVPQGVETIDQATLAPGESVFLVAGSSGWITVGFGRSSTFNFTRLNKSLTGYGVTDASISSTEAANKIINFYGSPSQDTNVIFPSVASVYYVSSALSTYTINIKTATGSQVSLAPGDATIVICDGVNFSIALSSTYATSISLPSGTAASPSLKFSASTNTGLYLPTGGQLGLVAGGAERIKIDNASGASTTYTTNSLDIGRIDGSGSPWTPANLWVGYGSISCGYNGSVGVQLTATATVSTLTLNNSIDSSISTKGYNLSTVGTTTYFGYPSALFSSLKMTSSGDLTVGKNLLLDNSGTTSKLGFTTGAGGAITQATDKTTGVTLNKSCGQITMAGTALAAGTSVAFTLTNSTIGANDYVGVSIKSGAASNLSYSVGTVATAAGSCVIKLRNDSAGSLSEALVLNFVVISGSAS